MGNGGSLASLHLALAVAAAAALGCATYRVEPADSDPLRDEYRVETLHSWLWGFQMSPEVFAADCSGHGINDVVIRRLWYQDLVSVVTLGIWSPIEARFRCRAPPLSGGAFPVPE